MLEFRERREKMLESTIQGLQSFISLEREENKEKAFTAASNEAIKQKLYLFAPLSTKHKRTSICYRYKDETKWYKTNEIFKENSQRSFK